MFGTQCVYIKRSAGQMISVIEEVRMDDVLIRCLIGGQRVSEEKAWSIGISDLPLLEVWWFVGSSMEVRHHWILGDSLGKLRPARR